MDAFITGFSIILQWQYILIMFGGVTLGMVLGALPGLTGGMGIALMLPFTFSMEPLTALVFLLSIYTGGLFGGSTTAIMINTPGSPANMATLLDGYPMNKKGEAGRALGLALMSSVVGGLIGCVFILMATEKLAYLSLRFGPAEMFMVTIFGLSVVGSLSKNILKSLFSGALGILLGTVGMSPTGAIRGSMGNIYLLDGFPLMPAMIGLLALPEIFNLLAQEEIAKDLGRNSFKEIIRGIVETIKHPIQLALCSILGVIVGIMPAAGATVAGILGYNQSKQWMKNTEDFGTGAPRGIIGAETANNASQGGALATMFVLGIPGSNSTAMMLGALVIQGWAPGPRLFIDHKDVIYASFSSLFVQQIVMLLVGLVICSFAAQIIKIPVKYLVPCILVFTILGAFSNRNTLFDASLMLAFGVIGWFMKKNDFAIMPIILGIILGSIADRELLRIYQSFDGFLHIFQRPIVLILTGITVVSIIVPGIKQTRTRLKERALAKLE
jgi:putative tricarboxylic transport membrane protein